MNKINKLLGEKKFLIATHRGVYGANIVDNTIESIKLAIELNTDMVEVDAVLSTDKKLYAFHSGEEEKRFGEKLDILKLSSKEIEKLEYLNVLGEKSGYKVNKLEDILKYIKGTGKLVNIDRAWNYFEEVFELVKKLEMEDVVLIKSAPDDEFIEFLKKTNIKLMYMPIIKNKDDIHKCIDENINLVAAELLVYDEKDDIFSGEYLKFLKENNILLWLNSIKLAGTEKHRFNAGYDDDISLFENGKGWKWMIDNGAEIIQTDWPYFLNKFRDGLKK